MKPQPRPASPILILGRIVGLAMIATSVYAWSKRNEESHSPELAAAGLLFFGVIFFLLTFVRRTY